MGPPSLLGRMGRMRPPTFKSTGNMAGTNVPTTVNRSRE